MTEDAASKLARRLFHIDHPGRPWSPSFVERGQKSPDDHAYATEEERERYLELANKQILDEALKADG